HAIAVEAAAQKLVGGAPEIEAEAPVVEIAEALDDEFPVGVEIARPLLEGEEIAVAVVQDLHHLQRGLGELVEEIVEDQEGVVAAVDVFDHEGGELVLL